MKKHLLPVSVTAPLISAPQAGRKTGYASFLEARGSPRRVKSSRQFQNTPSFVVLREMLELLSKAVLSRSVSITHFKETGGSEGS